MDRQQRITVDLAVQVLSQAMAASGEERADTPAVRLARRCLRRHCPERWPLVSFWEAAGQTNEIGRFQGVTAGFNAIVRQLRKSGAYTDSPLELTSGEARVASAGT